MFRPQATILCLTLLSALLVNALTSANVCPFIHAKRIDETCYDLERTERDCESAFNSHLVYDNHAVLRAGSLEKSSFDIVNGSCKTLTVSGLQYIEPGGFQGLENITTLVILNDYFDIIEHDMFKHLDNLENLVIGGNYTKIINIRKEAFLNLRNLINLTLSNNAISDIQAEIFKGLINVTFLDLSYNELKQLVQYSFTHLPSLKNLDLQNNKLTWISDKAFFSLTKLQKIDLRDNLIKVITKPLLGIDQIQVTVDLTGNPLFCDCRMAWISSWHNDTQYYGQCHAPKEEENLSLADVYAVVDGIPQCYNGSVITHEVGKLLELPCSGIDCIWTTPDGKQLSEHGERQGPYFLTNYDALVIDSSDPTASSNNGSYSYYSLESGHQNLNVQFQFQDEELDDVSTLQIIVVTLVCSVMVIVVISLIYKVKSTKFGENEENTPLVSLNPYLSGSAEENTPLISSHSSYLSGSAEENTPLVSSHLSYLSGSNEENTPLVSSHSSYSSGSAEENTPLISSHSSYLSGSTEENTPLISSHSSLSGSNEEKTLLISSHSSYLSGSNEISSDQLGTKHYSYAIRKNTDHSGSDNSI